jgi:IclR family acetate operon transcriptional repressor
MTRKNHGTSTSRSAANDPVQSVGRALELLEVLRHRPSATISELAAQQGVHRATTLRLLQTLERYGYVSRGSARGEFRLGLKCYELGALFGERFDLLRAARPTMRMLAAETGETIDLALYDRGEVLLIESIAARPLARVGSPVGRRTRATCTTTGKVHLAALEPNELEEILSTYGLPRLGPKSITNREQFTAELARIRATGYALNDEETDANVRFVGVPLHTPDGIWRAGLILGAPAHRLSLNSVPEVARLLQDAARRIAEIA